MNLWLVIELRWLNVRLLLRLLTTLWTCSLVRWILHRKIILLLLLDRFIQLILLLFNYPKLPSYILWNIIYTETLVLDVRLEWRLGLGQLLLLLFYYLLLLLYWHFASIKGLLANLILLNILAFIVRLTLFMIRNTFELFIISHLLFNCTHLVIIYLLMLHLSTNTTFLELFHFIKLLQWLVKLDLSNVIGTFIHKIRPALIRYLLLLLP